MKITYIGHSGFLVELDEVLLLFDYFEGVIPALNAEKELVVFVSHRHKDHYNPAIFNLNHPKDKTLFILSKDVKVKGIENQKNISIQPHEEIYVGVNRAIHVTTLKSTDEGVAFLVCVKGRTIYHAGDLNLWKWNEESTSFNQKMTKDYLDEIARLKGSAIDVAFLPLDYRQEEYAFEGIQELLKIVRPRILIPMHMWKKYELVTEFNRQNEAQLVVINGENQTIEI